MCHLLIPACASFLFPDNFVLPRPFLLVPGGKDLSYIYCDPPPLNQVILRPKALGLSFSPQQFVFTKKVWNVSFEIFVSPTIAAGQLLVGFNVTGKDQEIFSPPPPMETFVTDTVSRALNQACFATIIGSLFLLKGALTRAYQAFVERDTIPITEKWEFYLLVGSMGLLGQ